MKYKANCCMCGAEKELEEPAPPVGKFLCPRCYEEVKLEYERQNPGQSLRLTESKIPKVQ